MLELRVCSHIYNYYKNIAFMSAYLCYRLFFGRLFFTEVIITESNVYQLQRRTRRPAEIFCSNFKDQACHIPHICLFFLLRNLNHQVSDLCLKGTRSRWRCKALDKSHHCTVGTVDEIIATQQPSLSFCGNRILFPQKGGAGFYRTLVSREYSKAVDWKWLQLIESLI